MENIQSSEIYPHCKTDAITSQDARIFNITFISKYYDKNSRESTAKVDIKRETIRRKQRGNRDLGEDIVRAITNQRRAPYSVLPTTTNQRRATYSLLRDWSSTVAPTSSLSLLPVASIFFCKKYLIKKIVKFTSTF